MADNVTQHNIAALGDLVRLSDHSTAVAAGSGDATTVTGITIDRAGFSTGAMPQSGLFGVAYEATLTSAKSLSLGYAIQDSADGTNFSDFQTATYATVVTGSATTAFKGCWNVAVDLAAARRYVRFNYIPDLSASGTDTFYADAVGFLGGFPRLPAPN